MHSRQPFWRVNRREIRSRQINVAALIRRLAWRWRMDGKSDAKNGRRGGGGRKECGRGSIQAPGRGWNACGRIGCEKLGRSIEDHTLGLNRSDLRNDSGIRGKAGGGATNRAGWRQQHWRDGRNRWRIHPRVLRSHAGHQGAVLHTVALERRLLVACAHEPASPGRSHHPGQQNCQENHRHCAF